MGALPPPVAANDADVIPYYMEYFLAPAIEAIQSAEVTLGHPVNIILGSVSTFSAGTSQTFLGIMMNYEIVGTYAPTLAGQTVGDLITIVSYHYLVTNGNLNWETSLDTAFSNYYGGNVKGLWATEEEGQSIGDADRGSGVVPAFLARYMSYWLDNDYDNLASRVFIWGVNIGATNTKGSDAMDYLMQVTGDAEPLVTTLVATYEGTNLEVHQFRFVNTHVAIISPLDRTLEGEITAISHGGDSMYFDSTGKYPDLPLPITLEPYSSIILSVEISPDFGAGGMRGNRMGTT